MQSLKLFARSQQRSHYFSSTRWLTSVSTKRISTPLKKLIKPFFLKCHPDVQMTPESKKVNLEAIQTINSFMDTLDATCDGKTVEWPTKLPVEFLLIREEITGRKRKPVERATRRTVELLVPSQSLRNSIVSSTGIQRQQYINKLYTSVKNEFIKILQVARISIPTDLDESFEKDAWDGKGIRKDAMDRNPDVFRRRFDTDERPTRRDSRSEARDRFFENFDQEEYRRIYNKLLGFTPPDMATKGAISRHYQRRQELINSVITKVHISKEADIEMLDQLITLRRISLLLEDNFDELYMETFGRMWEELTIVLTDPRQFSISGSSINRRKKRGLETGFQFTYCADKRVTAHIPIDFQDEEFLNEMQKNLLDWFNLVDELESSFSI
mmetsp:Transcript_18408/g.27812  ORF Transcript_18408/g.27812 Transcript_18408/m.27812 type:complete len:384 (+) Transcript_18408:143-1294(+)